MLGGIISIRRTRLGAEQFLGVLFITVFVAKQPDIDDELRIVLKILRLEFIDSPFHRVGCPGFYRAGRFVADDHKRRLDDHGKIVAGQFFLQGIDVTLKFVWRKCQRRLM